MKYCGVCGVKGEGVVVRRGKDQGRACGGGCERARGGQINICALPRRPGPAADRVPPELQAANTPPLPNALYLIQVVSGMRAFSR